VVAGPGFRASGTEVPRGSRGRAPVEVRSPPGVEGQSPGRGLGQNLSFIFMKRRKAAVFRICISCLCDTHFETK